MTTHFDPPNDVRRLETRPSQTDAANGPDKITNDSE